MSLKVAASNIGAGGVGRSLVVAMLDLISSGNAKGIGSICERKDKTAAQTYQHTLHDEGLEPMWETFFCSLLTKAAKIITPAIPEQITMIPGKLIGAAWHWAITSYQSTNRERLNGGNGNNQRSSIADFFETFVKRPSDYVLKFCGLGSSENDTNFLKFGLTQLGLFGIGSYFLSNSEENLPGVNIDSGEPSLKCLAKGLGYTVVEQITYAMSQIMRFYIDFKDEFGKNALAKATANVINERFFPGHILAGIAASISTYLLGKHIPKTTAAALGEFPMMLLNRVMNCHKRRATKDIIVDGERVTNYNAEPGGRFEGFLKLCDKAMDPLRNSLVSLVSKIFNVKEEELKESFDIPEETLMGYYEEEKKREREEEELRLSASQPTQNNFPHVVPLTIPG